MRSTINVKSGLFLFCLLFFVGGLLKAQNGITGGRDAESVMQVKQLEEFMLRFNQKQIPGVSEENTVDAERRVLLSLFDYDVLENRSEEVMAFVTSVLKNKDNLSYSDTNWYAIAECNVTYKKKSNKIALVLRTEFIDEEMYKWVIVSADGDMLKLSPRKKSKFQKLFPTENEMNFMQLNDITSHEPENILNYSVKTFSIDQTSVFYALVATDQLKVLSVQDLSYQFQISEYVFWLKYYSRESTNSGWLIYDLKKINQ